ncbi:MAG: hypothetical protein AAB567_01490 [Patescibacteria group bacterium]
MNDTPQKQIRAGKELKASSAHFLDGLLEKSYEFAQHLDAQTNILVGVSTAIFLFSLSAFLGDHPRILFLVLGFFSGLSSLIGLFAIHPPKFMRKRGQEESLMYNKKIASFLSAEEYGRELGKILDDGRAVTQQYATEIYNVAKYYYRPKRRLFHWSRNILIAGIFFSLLSFLISLVE